MFEFLFEILAEFVLQIAAEALAEIGLHSLAEPFRKDRDPWLAGVGYALFGALAGLLSLLAFSSHLVTAHAWRIVNVIVTPLAAGLFMGRVGAWRMRRGQEVLRIDRFAYGYLFALGLALVRLWFAK